MRRARRASILMVKDGHVAAGALSPYNPTNIRPGTRADTMQKVTDAIRHHPGAAFGCFLALHFAIWTALPAIFYANLPLDLIEALVYGREWQLGYDKLPPLPWWLVEATYQAFGHDIFYYA